MQTVGHIGRDATVQSVGDRFAINFPIAHNDRVKKGDTYEDQTIWIDCTVWRNDDKSDLPKFLKIGQLVAVSGKPAMTTWVSKSGEVKTGWKLTVQELSLHGKKAENAGQDTNEVNQTFDEVDKKKEAVSSTMSPGKPSGDDFD